jgi:hypothetical protein
MASNAPANTLQWLIGGISNFLVSIWAVKRRLLCAFRLFYRVVAHISDPIRLARMVNQVGWLNRMEEQKPTPAGLSRG